MKMQGTERLVAAMAAISGMYTTYTDANLMPGNMALVPGIHTYLDIQVAVS
jgi:hypothetical protein